LFATVGVILPAKTYALLLEGQQAMIGNGHTMGVPNGFTAELPVTRGVVPIKTKVCRKVL